MGVLDLLSGELVSGLKLSLKPATDLVVNSCRHNHEMTQNPASGLLPERSWSVGKSERSTEHPSELFPDDDER